MELTQGPFTSADWLVTKGNEQTFMEQWESLARISLESPGARWFFLIRDVAEPRHFVSFGQWDDFGSITTARSWPRFLDQFRRCQALCDESRGGDYEVAVAAPSPEPG